MSEPAKSTVELLGQPLELSVSGSGRSILFLSAGVWLASDAAFAADLAKLGRVTAPAHPGFGKHDAGNHLTTADDLSYLYLDLIEHILADDKAAKDVTIVAASLGAYVAAQMAIKSCQRIASLVLIGPMGVKAGNRDARDYVDLFAHAEPDLVKLAFTDPARFQVDLTELPEAAVTDRIRAREALARFVWQPYMHDPKLARRLHRITAPTLLLRGADDRIVVPAVADMFAENIPGARLEKIDRAGHLPHVEQPAATLAKIAKFLESLPAAAKKPAHR